VEKGQKRITSADVARASGVSRATVSYVLNNDPRQSIPSETRERILRVAQELGYHPFTPARILRTGHSQIVLAVLQLELVDPKIAGLLKNLEVALAERGYSLIWYVGWPDRSDGIHLSANLTPAVIVSLVDESDPAISSFLQQFNVPIVQLENDSFREMAGKTQARYLIQQGYHHLVFASPDRRDLQKLAMERLEGVRQGCAECSLDMPFVQIVPHSRKEAKEAIRDLLSQRTPPFGICCYNDDVAIAVIAALSDAGIRVPEAVAVIGCDNIPLAQFINPPLTTLDFDEKQLLDLLIENIFAANQGRPMQESTPISISIIARGSA
jgi:DNA-binding LacI/PurR family transcriptional regulator